MSGSAFELPFAEILLLTSIRSDGGGGLENGPGRA